MDEGTRIKVDGEEAFLHITAQSIMFEKKGMVSGFERNAIRMVKPDGDTMIIAYTAGSEVKSVRVEPMTAVASVMASSASPTSAQASTASLDAVFEKLYWDARKELEEKLVKVQIEPRNKNFRITMEEESRYADTSRQMESLIGTRYGSNQRDFENSPVSFWGLEKRPYELQLAVVKVRHIRFLRLIAGPKAEQSDIVYSTDEVWPEDWPRILERFNLGNAPYVTQEFNAYLDYLKPHWENKPGMRKPVLARP